MRNKITMALALAFAITCISDTDARQQTPKQETQVKITDTRLHSINYGIDSLEHWVGKAKQGDTGRAKALLHDHTKLAARFARIPKSESQQYKFVANRLKKLRQEIERKTSESASGLPGSIEGSTEGSTVPSSDQASQPVLHRDVVNLAKLIDGLETDLSRYKDNLKQRLRIKSDIANLKTRFDRIPSSAHPEHTKTRQRIVALEKALQPEGGPLDMSTEQVAEYIEQIRKRYSEDLRLPEARDIMTNRELTADDVDGVVGQIEAFHRHAEEDLPKLRRVVQATGQGQYWLKWLETNSVDQQKRNLDSIVTLINNRIDSDLRDAKNRSELDPEKNRYVFNNEAMRTQHRANHQRALQTIQQASRLEKLLKLPTYWSAKKFELQGHISAYESKVVSVAQIRELPPEVGNRQQHEIAAEVFKVEKYGVGEIVKQIVNSKIVPRERIQHKPSGNSIETVVRVWEQFQVSTVEKEGDQYFVYTNDLAKFSRAPGTTPIDKWILKQRFKRGRIAQDKF